MLNVDNANDVRKLVFAMRSLCLMTFRGNPLIVMYPKYR